MEYRVVSTEGTRAVNLTRLATPSGSNSLIGQGDLLELTIVTGYETNGPTTLLVRVDEAGAINVPLIGRVQVVGLEPDEAEQNVATLAVQRGVYQHPYVTLMVKRQRANKVTVVGAVETPGTFQLPHASSDLLGALAAAGGLTDAAGTNVEVVRKAPRPGRRPTVPGSNPSNSVASSLASYNAASSGVATPQSYRVDLAHVSDGGKADYGLGDGDVVMVFPREPRMIHVMGLVRKPNQFEIPPNDDVRLLDALAMAGGRTLQVADKVRIVRQAPDGSGTMVIMASVREAKAKGQANLLLAPGDLVSVEETPVTFTIDTLRNLVRFGFSAATPFF
jgi:polysaccharide biosynthesis/export protein